MIKDINIRYFISLCIVNVLTVNVLYADCCKNKEKKGKGCCVYGQNKDNDEINRDDDNKESDDDKKKKEEEDNGKEDPLKNKKSILKNKLKEVIQNNEKLEEKDIFEIKTKDKDIDDCKDDKSLDNISKDLDDLHNKIIAKISKNNKEAAKQIIINKKNSILNIFNEVEKLIKEINKIIENTFIISCKKEQIESEENIENLSNFENDLNKQKEELSELINDINDDSICKNEEDFIIKFNKRKNVLSYRFIDKMMKTKLKDKNNNLILKNIFDYFTMYNKMIKDTFTHKASLDLQIYRYILKLEGFIDALDNIFKKNIYYDFYTYYNITKGCRYESKVYKKDNNYYLNIASKSNEKEYTDKGYKKIRDIYSGMFRVDDEYFKYVRCIKDSCTNGENCISCKLRNLLEKENVGEIYKDKYKEYGELTGNNNVLSSFIQKCFTDPSSTSSYEEKSLIPEKKAFMIEWALTIEFMKRFIKKLYGKEEFYLYRTLFLSQTDSFKKIEKGQKMDGKNFCESNSIFGPCYYKHEENSIYYFLSIKAEYYRCFCNHIINPFPERNPYGKTDFEYLNGKLLDDYESEIVYIPKNQKYKVEEICVYNDKPEKNLLEYSIRKSLENFKINMKNDPYTKNSKLYSLNGTEIKEIE